MRLFVYPAALFLAFILYCAAPKFAGGLARALQKLYALFQRLDARARALDDAPSRVRKTRVYSHDDR